MSDKTSDTLSLSARYGVRMVFRIGFLMSSIGKHSRCPLVSFAVIASWCCFFGASSATTLETCYLHTPEGYQRIGGASSLGPYISRSECESINLSYFQDNGTCTCGAIIKPKPEPPKNDAKKHTKREQTDFDR